MVGSLISPDGNLHACRHREVDILITRVPPSEAATKTDFRLVRGLRPVEVLTGDLDGSIIRGSRPTRPQIVVSVYVK